MIQGDWHKKLILPVDAFLLNFNEAAVEISQHGVTLSAFDALSEVIGRTECQTDLRLSRRLPNPRPVHSCTRVTNIQQ